jgi:hypothetical protein
MPHDSPVTVRISYTEPTSASLAEVVGWWLSLTLPFCPVQVVSDADIGRRVHEGQDADPAPNATCLCVTPAALRVPSLYFAAGALYPLGAMGARIVPILLDVDPEDLQNTPLAMFQAAQGTRADLAVLAESLNELAGQRLSSSQLQVFFDRSWPEMERRLERVPGEAVHRFEITIAHSSNVQTFPYDPGSDDDEWDSSVGSMLEALARPDSPVRLPALAEAELRYLDVDRERWLPSKPMLLSRAPSHIALITDDVIDQWGSRPWLLVSMIRARSQPGQSLARYAATGGFVVAP